MQGVRPPAWARSLSQYLSNSICLIERTIPGRAQVKSIELIASNR